MRFCGRADGEEIGQQNTTSREGEFRLEHRGTVHIALAERRWAEQARRAFSWFLGQNQLQQSLYDPGTSGCRDGLHADRVNENQGAESTISFLLALRDMRSENR